tara:strand:- start:41545 stop:42414 length:870 start_codon:yes stop_codon:yes gene_type:complete
MKSNRGRKKKSIQVKLRSKIFSFDQYWCLHFTEKYVDGSEKDFKCVIKARSADFAKKILSLKIKFDQPKTKVKSISAYMFRKNSEINTKLLNLKDWDCIKKCSFPNELDILFKYNHPRPSGYTNRFNSQSSPKNRFQKGEDARRFPNKKNYTREEKAHMLYDGSWQPWPKKDRDGLLEKVIILFKLHNNVRSKVAENLGISIKELKSLLNKKFIEINWEKDYPVSHEIKDEHRLLLKKAREEKTLSRILKLQPAIEGYIMSNKTKKFMKESLGISHGFLNKCIKYYEFN